MPADSQRLTASPQAHSRPRAARPTNTEKRFRLLRSFSLTSLAACVIVVIVLASFYRQSALIDLGMVQERQHVALTQVIANMIWRAHAPVINAADSRALNQPLTEAEIASLHQDVHEQLRGTAVLKVKIYNRAGITIFSTKAYEIGEAELDDEGVTGALAGQVASELTLHDTLSRFDAVVEARDVFSSYVPLRGAEPGAAIVGAFEIYTDVTPFLAQIASSQLRVASGVALALAALYAVLFVIVRRADRILYNEALERQRAAERPWRQALTFENTYDSVVVTERDGTIIDCNPATQQIFGVERAQVLASDLRRWYPAGELDRLQSAPAQRSTATLPFPRPDGTTGVCEVVVAPRYDEHEQLVGWLWISHDITEQARTRAELIAARDAAEAANRAKSIFLANMSHELRTPLTAILGYSDLLADDLRESPDSHAAHAIGCVQKAGRHLLALINDLIDLARIEAGRIDLHAERVALPSLVAEVSELVQPLVLEHANTLEVHCDPQIEMIWADPGKLRQMLLNILGNASKFTQNGRITLKVDYERDGSRDWIRLSVTDTGIGIAKDQIGLLFQPFSQADSSATRKHGGAGLGLAISARICALMGGQISVTSEPGKGSTFLLLLPAQVIGEHTPIPDRAQADQPDVSETASPPHHLLQHA